MKCLLSIITVLLFATAGFSDDGRLIVFTDKVYSYEDGAKLAKQFELPLVTYVGAAPRPIEGVIVAEAKTLSGFSCGDVVISTWKTGEHIGDVYSKNPTSAKEVKAFAKKIKLAPTYCPTCPTCPTCPQPTLFQRFCPNCR